MPIRLAPAVETTGFRGKGGNKKQPTQVNDAKVRANTRRLGDPTSCIAGALGRCAAATMLSAMATDSSAAAIDEAAAAFDCSAAAIDGGAVAIESSARAGGPSTVADGPDGGASGLPAPADDVSASRFTPSGGVVVMFRLLGRIRATWKRLQTDRERSRRRARTILQRRQLLGQTFQS